MANNLSGISYTSNFNNLDGLSIVDADVLYIDGVPFDPTTVVPYVGANKEVDLNSQNIKTTHNAVAGPDLVNLTTLQAAIAYVDAGVAASFLNKVTTNNQTITGNVQANGGFTFTQNTVLNTLQLQSDDNVTMSWTTSVSNGTPNDLTFHAVQTGNDVVFRDTGVLEAVGAKLTGATALRAVVTDVNKNLATSNTTVAEIGYLSGVTSNIQSQINALVPYTGANSILNMGSYLVRSSAVPIAGQDLCNKTYVDGKVSSYAVAKAGDTMTGALLMGTNKITTSYVPVDNVDLTNKLYVDNAVSGSGSKWTLSGSDIYNNNTGNVGIGTTIPNAPLTVFGASPTYFRSNDATYTTCYSEWRDYSATGRLLLGCDGNGLLNFQVGAGVFGTWGATNLYLTTAATTRMTILSGGNVGIGKTNPGSLLDVNGTFASGDISSSGAITCSGYLKTGASHTFYNTASAGLSQGLWFNGIETGYPEKSYASINCYYKAGSYSSFGTDLQFSTVSVNGLSPGRARVQRMVITSEGNVGIGVSNPYWPLHVGDQGVAFTTSGQKATGYIAVNGGNDNPYDQRIVFPNPSVHDNTITGMYWWSPDFYIERWKNEFALGFKECHGPPLGNAYKDILRAYVTDSGGYQTLYQTTLTGLVYINGGRYNNYFNGGGGAYAYLGAGGVTYPAYGYLAVNFSLQCSDSILAQYFVAFSDKRVKRNIKKRTPALDDIARLTFYEYDNRVSLADRKEYGVLANDIKEVFPHMVSETAGWCPNIKQYAKHQLLDSGNVRIILDTPDEDIKVNDKIRLHVFSAAKKRNAPVVGPVDESAPHGFESQVECVILRVDELTVFEVAKWEAYDPEDGVFVYGTHKEDILTLDKIQLAMVALQGVQELMEENDKQRKQIKRLTERSQILEEHSRQIEVDLKATRDAFSAYREMTDARINKLASLVAQLIK